MVEKVDRKAILRGDVDIWLKETQFFLNNDFEICTIKHISTGKIAVVEKDGKCYVAARFDSYNIAGMLYETRDSFDELVAKYPPKEENKK